eukprot:6460514-Amphidinium_carterae.1
MHFHVDAVLERDLEHVPLVFGKTRPRKVESAVKTALSASGQGKPHRASFYQGLLHGTRRRMHGKRRSTKQVMSVRTAVRADTHAMCRYWLALRRCGSDIRVLGLSFDGFSVSETEMLTIAC